MERFLMFHYMNYCAKGGMEDFIGTEPTLEKAIETLNMHMFKETIECYSYEPDFVPWENSDGHILDLETGNVIPQDLLN